ncbi:aldo/keto reductase [Marinitoga aeolica]|uniref:Aldo/keto reductase n=2 Tax=Marinitoga aeolica TaxID=2809031 RepID=A0ABY8PQQ7_9BACT|nr:aldo/keto reductase [Marinitoga aeolica]WGS64951.1 aldo/keto reductase [Marinitoga aeolica]
MRVKLSKSNLEVSRIVQGMMRLNSWGYTEKELTDFIQKAIDIGVTTFDHADIYGNGECEEIFGNVLKNNPSIRNEIQLITKCGIIRKDENSNIRVKHYNTSKEHILKSVENSLKKLHTDYIDLLLIHRPDPFMNPEEIAEAFYELHKSGKVLNFGVSNFTIQQFKTLQEYTNLPLITNQIEISPYNLEHFENENIYFLLQKKINPMAWSPLAGGKIFNPSEEKGQRILKALKEVAKDFNVSSLDKIVYAWLLNHPVGIIPISGSGKIERLKNAVEAIDIKMNREQWFMIYEAALGHKVP